VPDVLAAARARPGQVSFGSAGVGSAQHLSGELLKQKAGVDMTHVPYRGATPAVVDILGGRTDFMITNLADISRQVLDGGLRLLAIGDSSRSALFPDAPPLARLVPGFDVTGWFGICGPRGMTPEVVARWEAALRQSLTDPVVQKRLTDSGLNPLFEDAATLGRRIETDRRTWRGVIQSVGVRAE
jgi:tripartite-type tricarboxylate transporter receptor subunit TctC